MHSEKKIYLTFYVNNVKFIESDEQAFNKINHQIMKHFQITNLDQIHHYLDMKIEIDYQSQHQDLMICLSQKIYIKQLLEQFDMQNCLLTSILMQHDLQILNQSFKKYIKFIIDDYQSLIENLQFLAIYTCSDIAFTMSFLTQ